MNSLKILYLKNMSLAYVYTSYLILFFNSRYCYLACEVLSESLILQKCNKNVKIF